MMKMLMMLMAGFVLSLGVNASDDGFEPPVPRHKEKRVKYKKEDNVDNAFGDDSASFQDPIKKPKNKNPFHGLGPFEMIQAKARLDKACDSSQINAIEDELQREDAKLLCQPKDPFVDTTNSYSSNEFGEGEENLSKKDGRRKK